MGRSSKGRLEQKSLNLVEGSIYHCLVGEMMNLSGLIVAKISDGEQARFFGLTHG